MAIVNFGHFKLTSTSGTMFFTNEDGQDWYDLRRSLTEWDEQGTFLTAIYGAWALVDPVTLKVANVEYDPSRLVPHDRIVLGIDADADDITEGMLYSNGEIVPAPPPTAEETRAALPNISARQLWLMARQVGITKAQVLAELEHKPEDDEETREHKDVLYIELTEPPLMGYRRDSPAAEDFREYMGLPPEQFDDMWRMAQEI